MELIDVYEEVFNERERQIVKWGTEQDLIARWLANYNSITPYLLDKYAILGEEIGEVARGILNNDIDNVREELIQCAAVCVAIIEGIDGYVKA